LKQRATRKGAPRRPPPPAPAEVPTTGRGGLAARAFAFDPELRAVDPHVVAVLALSAVLLTVYAYFGTDDFYVARLGSPGDTPLAAFAWQSASAVVLRILVPLAWIVLVFRDSPRDYGFRMPERGHNGIYLYLFLGMLPVLAAVSFLPSFQRMYPIYADAYASVGTLVAYLAAYTLRFAAVEAFFRGFLLFALHRRFGYHAIAIMMVPYCMIHFVKPFPEALGSIAAGLVLGYLALRSRSWLPGAALHSGIAVAMDLLGIWQRT